MNSVSDLIHRDFVTSSTSESRILFRGENVSLFPTSQFRTGLAERAEFFFRTIRTFVTKASTNDYNHDHKISLKRSLITCLQQKAYYGPIYTMRYSTAGQIINSLKPTIFILAHVRQAPKHLPI